MQKADPTIADARKVIEGLLAIRDDSQGVAGYHRNGDIADWGEFDEINAAEAFLEASATPDLAANRDDLRAILFRMADHLKSFIDHHPSDRTSETEALLYLVAQERNAMTAPPREKRPYTIAKAPKLKRDYKGKRVRIRYPFANWRIAVPAGARGIITDQTTGQRQTTITFDPCPTCGVAAVISGLYANSSYDFIEETP